MNKNARLSFIVISALSLGLGFTCGAYALPGAKPKPATLNELQGSSPEISAAELRVEQAKAQVDLANKQVNAARALLRAAQADLKAAGSHLTALKLNAHAQGLVETTGMTPAKAPPVSIAAKAPVESKTEETPAPAPTSAPAPAEDTRIKTDFNQEPATSEPIQLR